MKEQISGRRHHRNRQDERAGEERELLAVVQPPLHGVLRPLRAVPREARALPRRGARAVVRGVQHLHRTAPSALRDPLLLAADLHVQELARLEVREGLVRRHVAARQDLPVLGAQRGVLEEEEVRTQRLEESRREAAARLRINGPAVPLFRSFILLFYTACFSALSEKLNPWSAFSELFFGPDLLLAPPILAS